MKKAKVESTTHFASPKTMLAITAAILITVYYRLTFPFFLLLLYLAYLLWSYYWTWMSCRRMQGRSDDIEEHLFVGDGITRTFSFTNEWLFPLIRGGVRFVQPAQFTVKEKVSIVNAVSLQSSIEVSNSTGRIVPSFIAYTASYAWLPEKEEVRLSLHFEAQKRGMYYFPPAIFFVGDPSGLYHGEKEITHDQDIYVYPKLIKDGQLQRILVYEDHHRDYSYGFEDPYQLQGIRDYQLTDSPKSINWYATAKTNSLKSNLYQRKDSEYCLVVLDTSVYEKPSLEVDRYRIDDPLFEKIISIAAGLALFHLEQGAKTAFYTNAPLLEWAYVGKKSTDYRNRYLKKIRQVSTMEFNDTTAQGTKILKLCAKIDETSRGSKEGQASLWALLEQMPSHTQIYIIGYFTPPQSWSKLADYESEADREDPANFYSPHRLGKLPASKVRFVNLSKKGNIK